MVKSIQYFNEISVVVFEKVINDFSKDPKDFAGFVWGLREELRNVGIRMIEETLEEMDAGICRSGFRKESWNIEQHNKRCLLTSLGMVSFRKTLFENKETGERTYLLDRMLGLEKGERISEDAEAEILKEAVETSYRRGGEAASVMDAASKQTVMKKVHGLQFPVQWKEKEEKKEVPYLYVEADEDHVPLQFRQVKGDLKKDKNGRKNNKEIVKLVYVHEGIQPEAPKSKRHKLVNPFYFSEETTGKDNREFWEEVYRYMDKTYDLSKVKKIYVNSDGGAWILAGIRQLRGLVHVLDEYHLNKSIQGMSRHMKDSADDVKDVIRKTIRTGNRKDFEELSERLTTYFEKGNPTEQFVNSRNYIYSNWTAAKYRLKKVEGSIGSSTEGHVSHILAERMSTKAMGWSRKGAGQMARLRVYYKNGGDMLELVRYQKKAQPLAAGAEEVIFSSAEIIRQETVRHDRIAKYYNAMNHSISLQNRKQLYFSSQFWL